MTKHKPVLLRDFDGVLHSNGCGAAECFCLLPTLADTITPFEIDVVISSSWQFQGSLRFEPIWVIARRPAGAHWTTSILSFRRNWRDLIHCGGARGCQSTEFERLTN
jgi:hypothetical protein